MKSISFNWMFVIEIISLSDIRRMCSKLKKSNIRSSKTNFQSMHANGLVKRYEIYVSQMTTYMFRLSQMTTYMFRLSQMTTYMFCLSQMNTYMFRLSQMTTYMFLCVTNNHLYVHMCHK